MVKGEGVRVEVVKGESDGRRCEVVKGYLPGVLVEGAEVRLMVGGGKRVFCGRCAGEERGAEAGGRGTEGESTGVV